MTARWRRAALVSAVTLCCGGALAAAPARLPAAEKTVRVLVAADQESVLAAQMAGRIDQVNVKLGS